MRTRLWITLAAGILAFLPAAAAAATSQPAHKTVREAWAAQTLSGKIAMVDPQQNLLVVTDSSGTPFDLKVTHATAIRSGSERLTLDQLNGDVNHNVSVRFIPERSGDIASSIQIPK